MYYFNQSLVAFPRLKRQILLTSSEIGSLKEFKENTEFWINEQFCLVYDYYKILLINNIGIQIIIIHFLLNLYNILVKMVSFRKEEN